MKKTPNLIFTAGCLLMAAGLVLLLFLLIRTGHAERTNDKIVQTMEAILTERSTGTVDPERIPEMPILELKGDDYIALLELPSYGIKLPVGSGWNKGAVAAHPCRFYGSAYDGTLIIGGYDSKGQFDSFDRIYIDTPVKLTDMTGCTYSYTVTRIDRSKTAAADILMDEAYHLTLFVRDAQLGEYILLRCTAK